MTIFQQVLNRKQPFFNKIITYINKWKEKRYRLKIDILYILQLIDANHISVSFPIGEELFNLAIG